ncbi:FtsH protease activity modulator HflK [Ponticoccus sp. SC2-23]|uniref:FtsH protease activity modulator HflK n=1 Tax=Alexandriicola marinus TaxID=2081710 RepID=UPI000FDCA8AF|nr:FtsH protease activity modulator HflK [Alexandriicola marinus]MBM1219572.1 FtsH protease activity modulator HflK [Ponticoccus sp. SC6-9]MBM1223356.1 FtsH protease activity modulator HflK [Ponticoccus sp. SC6-15]MBM1229385.1 FtsH protease activity modulator HflK [Ponticoccus sp. SC6-38]MBM1232322.1 FtsH protease activity modulator HflK [Ponticoccus sp. SC6-45]MBM1237728.1 FtsH protease activity modulator HflK [Ponticoccus sp. SC6-49]MBM1241333.1 FtsH protease activity modulator HflK [Pontic
MAGNNGGPWGGGGRGPGGGDDDDRRPQGGRGPGQDGPQIPEIDDLVNKGREQLRVLMGGGGGRRNVNGSGGGGPQGPMLTRGTVGIGALVALGLWAFMSFYTVRPEEQSVELFLGSYSSTGNPGLNFAPWPLVTYEVVNVTSERTESIGTSGGRNDNQGLMLTTDANIVDIGFQVVWNVSDPAKLLFNLADPQQTVQAVSESVMREVIAASNLAPILNRDRGLIAQTVQENIQATLVEYDSGINVVRVNLDRADPPAEVIDAFRDVQAAEQERDRLQRTADAYANRVLAEARGQAAQVIEEAEGYRARVTNDAIGQASRFTAILQEYQASEDVTRRRIYLETMERVLGDVNKIVLDESVAGGGGNSGTGVVPFLPLNELTRNQGVGTTAIRDQGN